MSNQPKFLPSQLEQPSRASSHQRALLQTAIKASLSKAHETSRLASVLSHQPMFLPSQLEFILGASSSLAISESAGLCNNLFDTAQEIQTYKIKLSVLNYK